MIDSVPKSLEDIAVDFGANLFEVERRFLAALWLSPIDGHDVAVDCGLGADHFADRVHGFLFCYVCRGAELGMTPTLQGCIEAARRHGIWIGDDYRRDPFDWLHSLILATDTKEGLVREYAARVREFAEIRTTKAQHHIGQLGRLLIDPGQYTFNIRRHCTLATHIPSRLRRNGVRRDARIAV